MPLQNELTVPHRSRGFWPREHGAYVQLLAPMLSALAFVGAGPAALLCAALAVGLFLAHEPLVVLLGQRGARNREANARAARAHLAARLVVSALFGAALLRWAAAAVIVSLSLPAAFGLGALGMLLRRRERSLRAQLLVTAALTSFAAPVLVAQGVAWRSIAIFVAGWLAAQLLAMFTARAYVYRRRDAEHALRAASFAAMFALGAALLLVARGHVPLVAGLALAPFAIVAAALGSHAYQPRTPKGVGWALTLANLAAVVLFGMTLDGS